MKKTIKGIPISLIIFCLFVGYFAVAITPRIIKSIETSQAEKLQQMQEQAENPQAEEPKAAPKPKFELIGEPVAKKDGLYTISGILKNNTDKTYSYAQICFNVYDKDGNQLGTAVANVNNLDGNGTWKFEAIPLTMDYDEIQSFKYIGVDAY